jgi:hypothetical protein
MEVKNSFIYCGQIRNDFINVLLLQSLELVCLQITLSTCLVNGLGQIMISLRSISSKFYEQLLSPKIPKVQKDTDDLTEFLRYSDHQAKKL